MTINVINAFLVCALYTTNDTLDRVCHRSRSTLLISHVVPLFDSYLGFNSISS
jgi:hypothetical protein